MTSPACFVTSKVLRHLRRALVFHPHGGTNLDFPCRMKYHVTCTSRMAVGTALPTTYADGKCRSISHVQIPAVELREFVLECLVSLATSAAVLPKGPTLRRRTPVVIQFGQNNIQRCQPSFLRDLLLTLFSNQSATRIRGGCGIESNNIFPALLPPRLVRRTDALRSRTNYCLRNGRLRSRPLSGHAIICEKINFQHSHRTIWMSKTASCAGNQL